MSRWEPDARGRLRRPRWSSIVERGFEQTTVAEIAERAGLTERTFFRHFADKREVLFPGQEQLLELFVSTVTGAPADASPLDAVAVALQAIATEFEPRRAVVAGARSGHPRQPGPAGARTDQARRGCPQPSRQRCASAASANRPPVSPRSPGIAVFHIGFAQWIDAGNTRTFSQIITEALAALKTVANG